MRVVNPLIRVGIAIHGLRMSSTQDRPATQTSPNILTSTSSNGRPSSIPLTALQNALPPLARDSRRVYLFRHGETDWNARGLMQGGGYDIDLNDDGHKQAIAAANELKGLPIGVVASSHLSRSEETADQIARQFPGAVRVISHKLGEMRFGSFEGQAVRGPESSEETRDRLSAYNQMMQTDKTVPFPGGGESIRDVEERATTGLHQILNDFPECDHLCLVAHGRFNKVLLRKHLLPEDSRSMNQGNTCINVVDIDKHGEWTAQVINFVDHTERLKEPPAWE